MSAFTEEMLKSMANVERTRAERAHAVLTRFSAEEKEQLLKDFHPDYKDKGFRVLKTGANKGSKVPAELAELLEGKSRVEGLNLDLSAPDYETDVLIIGGGGPVLLPRLKLRLAERKSSLPRNCAWATPTR